MKTKYPNVNVQLTGTDGNIFSIMGRVDTALQRAKVSQGERQKYTSEMFNCSSYQEALSVTKKWVSCK